MKNRKIISIMSGLSVAAGLLLSAQTSSAFWMWTPETNKWVNPKYSVKDTPGEQLKFALEFYEKKAYKEAIAEFGKLLKHYPRAKEAPEAQYYIGRCFEDQKDLFKASTEYQTVIDKYPFSELSGEIVQRQYDIGIKLLESKEKRGAFMTALTGSNYDVIDVFRAVIKNAPYGKLAAPAQYKIGLYLMEYKLYQEARDEFEKVLNDYPESEWVKAAKYQIAITDSQRSTGAQYDQKVTQSAVEEFKEFVEIYPDAELSKDAKEKISELKTKEAENNFLIAQFYEKQKNYASAKVYYKIVVDQYASSPLASQALSKIRELSGKENP